MNKDKQRLYEVEDLENNELILLEKMDFLNVYLKELELGCYKACKFPEGYHEDGHNYRVFFQNVSEKRSKKPAAVAPEKSENFKKLLVSYSDLLYNQN